MRVAEKGRLGAKLPADTGLGIATTFGQERDMPTCRLVPRACASIAAAAASSRSRS